MVTRDILFGVNLPTVAGFVVMGLSLTLHRTGQAGAPLSIGLMGAGTALVFIGLYAAGRGSAYRLATEHQALLVAAPHQNVPCEPLGGSSRASARRPWLTATTPGTSGTAPAAPKAVRPSLSRHTPPVRRSGVGPQ